MYFKNLVKIYENHFPEAELKKNEIIILLFGFL